MVENKLTGDDKSKDKQKKNSGLLKWYFWSFGVVLLSVLGYLGFLIYVSWPISTYSIDKSALLGDSFGVLSSLFSGLAFAGLIVTLAMQRKTLDAQMEELELARKEYKRQGDELEGQKVVMATQLEAIQLQQFESTFFRLLDGYRLVKETDLQVFESVEKVSFSSMLTKNPSKIAFKSIFNSSTEEHWKLWIRKIEALVRFTYIGYIDSDSKAIKTYVDILNDEIGQKELFWLLIALSSYSDENSRGVFISAGFFDRFDLDRSWFSLIRTKDFSPDLEKIIITLLSLSPDLVDRGSHLSMLNLARDRLESMIKNLTDECASDVSNYDKTLERHEELKLIAKDRFDLNDGEIEDILNSLYTGNDPDRDYIESLESITTHTQIELQLLISKNQIKSLFNSIEQHNKKIGKLNDLRTDLNKRLS